MSYSVRQEEFDGIEEDWERILPSCSTNTMFVTPSWQRLWWNHFGEGSKLSILSVRNGHQILGIAPLHVKDRVLSFLGDTDLFDYHDFLVPRGRETVFYQALCGHLKEMDWQMLELRSLPQDSPTLSILPGLAEQAGFTVDVTTEDVAPVASLPSSWDDYLAGLRKKDRHELRRKMRRLDETDAACQYVCDNFGAIGRCMQDFFKLMRASSPDKLRFMTPERERFFLDIARELAPRGQFRLFFLEVSGVRVAACICFDYADSYLLYNSGYDPSYSALSVGLLNKALCIKEAIMEGRRTFDFLRGTERYKYELGGQDRSICRLVIRR